MYKVFRVPVDAEDDPPMCGVEIASFHDHYEACEQADLIMASELDPESAYFVIDRTGREGTYSVGYIA